VTGPSFDLVAGWAAQGVPLKVAFKGIDRYFERYYAKGPRRRPVKIDFCEADVLDVFDEWRRATGVTGTAELRTENVEPRTPDRGPRTQNQEPGTPNPERRTHSLPAHLERVVTRLTAARAKGSVGDAFDGLIDRTARELDAARADARGLRGAARQALIARLATLDAELLQRAREMLDEDARAQFAREADAELAPFRSGMSPHAFARAQQAAIDRLVRERFNLPTIAY